MKLSEEARHMTLPENAKHMTQTENTKTPVKTVKEAIDLIKDRKWSESKLGLERITELLIHLGDPQDSFKIIHIAGTNGKGSTAVMLSNILTSAGIKTGLFTSPYLKDFNEQISIDGINIKDDDLLAAINRVFDEADRMTDHPTEFELIMAAAMLYFAGSGCDAAVVETGLGGRLDATNAVKSPALTALTPISMDHMEYLGNSLDEIAAEKAGIIKRGVPVCSAPQPPTAASVIAGRCEEMQSKLIISGPDALERISQDERGQYFTKTGSTTEYYLPLIGRHQLVNASLAISCIDTLNDMGCGIKEEAVRDGLAKTYWPGRMELISKDTVPVFIDGAHNVAGIESALATLEELYGDKKIIFVFGTLKDKEAGKMQELLQKRSKQIISVTPDSERAAPGKLTPEDGLAEAKRIAGAGDVICVLGSLYLGMLR